jgi:transcription elongation factor Elf1
MEKITFCENCGEDTEFEVRDEIITVDLKGLKFSYAAIVPYCKICGKEVSVAEINDLNLIRAYKAQKDTLEKE